MLSRIAHVLLVATSLAPVLLIYGVSRVREEPKLGATCVVISLLLAGFCHWVLWVAARRGEMERVVVSRSKSVDKEAVLFVVSYALPLIVPAHQAGSSWALAAFVGVVFVVLLQLQVAHVNPLLAVFGYHFFEVSPPSGETAILITRKNPGADVAVIVRLSDTIWLDLGK
ncbi:MAG: hypothetical protein QM756_06880 [Polyangiaceae bacterium]